MGEEPERTDLGLPQEDWGLAMPLGLELLALSEVCVLLLKKEKSCVKGIPASSPPLVGYQEI